ncbi:MAG: glycosyltransferase family 2 protein [Patescibacteria group bacterium]
MNRKTTFLLTVIVPVFNESGNIDALVKRLTDTVKNYNYEIIFVNDGSKDSTAKDVYEYCKNDSRIKLISFTRNFGHQNALSAGYQNSSGDCVVTIDADLQDPPELIHEMIKKWQEGDDIIYAKRKTRHKDTFVKKITAWGFYWFINKLSEIPIPEDVGDYRLLDISVVKYLNSLPEHARFLRGLVAWSGHKTSYVYFDRAARHAGETHYPIRKMLNFALTGITAFSTKPLRFVVYFGFATSAFGFLGMLYALIRRLMLPHEFWVTGWTALFVAIMFFSGVQILILGVVGEYIGKIFGQVQGRPLYLIKEKVNF